MIHHLVNAVFECFCAVPTKKILLGTKQNCKNVSKESWVIAGSSVKSQARVQGRGNDSQ